MNNISGKIWLNYMLSIGTLVWLSSELMFFSAIFSMYFMLRSVVDHNIWQASAEHLNVNFSIINTSVLVLSSVTCQMAVFAVEKNKLKIGRSWLWITFVMGLFFVLGQIFEYISLIKEHLTVSTNAWSSVFYFGTGFHGLHVVGGLIAFLFALGATRGKDVSIKDKHKLVITSYYWHFVDGVWIALFACIYLLK